MKKKNQDFGSDPIEVRNTEHYQDEYVISFVDKWDELIDWEARSESEGDFFIRELKKRGAKKVLDVATGTGFHSVRLLKAGFQVTSLDGNYEMLAKAFDNAKKHGYILQTVHSDWRWLSRDVEERFDAVICLGNSFTHLFSENDRRKSLAEFYSVLKSNGILIIDQRNYDGIIDNGYTSKHTFYYAGNNIKAEPEHIDEGLARFRYEFPDNSEFYLNMFPLRKRYMEKLMREVGFQNVTNYADFQETYKVSDPDFFIHIAEKEYRNTEPNDIGEMENDSLEDSEVVKITKDYYNSSDADEFYYNIWGGEDIHIGIYEGEKESIFDASRRTVEKMASLIKINKDMRILDLGSGYGGAARYLAKKYGCRISCLNLSKKENERNREKNKKGELDNLIDVIDGNFEKIPFYDSTFDIVWSEDAMLHSGNKDKVFEEAFRVLKTGGELIFTDPMQSDDCPEGVLQPVLDRIHLDSMGSFDFYKKTAADKGFKKKDIIDLSENLVQHYSRVHDELVRRYNAITEICSKEYIDRMLKGLNHWIEAGKKDYLTWGILHYKK